jgi:hypothetical protein
VTLVIEISRYYRWLFEHIQSNNFSVFHYSFVFGRQYIFKSMILKLIMIISKISSPLILVGLLFCLHLSFSFLDCTIYCRHLCFNLQTKILSSLKSFPFLSSHLLISLLLLYHLYKLLHSSLLFLRKLYWWLFAQGKSS